jgi:hypothetical protein
MPHTVCVEWNGAHFLWTSPTELNIFRKFLEIVEIAVYKMFSLTTPLSCVFHKNCTFLSGGGKMCQIEHVREFYRLFSITIICQKVTEKVSKLDYSGRVSGTDPSLKVFFGKQLSKLDCWPGIYIINPYVATTFESGIVMSSRCVLKEPSGRPIFINLVLFRIIKNRSDWSRHCQGIDN